MRVFRNIRSESLAPCVQRPAERCPLPDQFQTVHLRNVMSENRSRATVAIAFRPATGIIANEPAALVHNLHESCKISLQAHLLAITQVRFFSPGSKAFRLFVNTKTVHQSALIAAGRFFSPGGVSAMLQFKSKRLAMLTVSLASPNWRFTGPRQKCVVNEN